MAEIIAALLLLAGAGISLIAAIGVARLPDAFLRMHAATKAGVAGAGLVLLGTAIAFGSTGAWLRVLLILVFLLVTVPIASHALGRAAYVGGAPMWRGTRRDDLRGVLPRGDIDMPGAADAPEAALTPPPRLLLALADGPGADAALQSALDTLGPLAGEATLLALICTESLLPATAPAPGKADAAARAVEQRLSAARAALQGRAVVLEARCDALGLPSVIRPEEGKPAALLAEAAQQHDLLVMPRGGWFAQGQAAPGCDTTRPAARLALPGLLLVPPAWRAPARLWFLHGDDAAGDAALRRLLGLPFFGGLPIEVAVVQGPGAELAQQRALMMAAAAGRQASAGPLLPPDAPAPSLPGDVLPVVAAQPGIECRAWRSLREGAGALLLV